MKIVFMGTPDFARDSLRALVEAGHEIALVVTNPDKPKGRGMKMISSDVKVYAESMGLAVEQPLKVRNNQEFVQKLKYINPDVICVVAYGKIIPKEILEIPKFGCINVHGSLLPKYRGAAPIQWAVLNGDKETGVTTMFMDEGMDTGDMILTSKINIGDDETTGEVWNRLSLIGAKLLVETLERVESGDYERRKQTDDFTLAPMISKEIARIDWNNQMSQKIKNLVRGLNPFMGAYTFLNDKKIKFWRVQVIDRKFEVMPGTVVEADAKSGLAVATRDGAISVLEIQGENSRRMAIGDYLRGNMISVGERFE